MKLFKLLGNKKLFILLVGLILFIALMGFTLTNRTSLSWPEKFVRDTVGFVQGVFYKPASYMAGLFEDIGNLDNLYEENQQLKLTAAQYLLQQASYNKLVQLNKSYKEDLKFTQQQLAQNQFDLHIANVTSVDTDADTGTIVIDLGQNDGVRKDMPVISIKGMVGIISETSPFHSTVKLLTTLDPLDSNSKAIAATVVGKENESFGMIESYDKATGMLTMTQIKENDPLKRGDEIVSSGSGGLFPSGMIIGKVVSRQVGDFGLTNTATIQPAADFKDWKEVFVVYTKETQE
ncbi:rod shape-determining protein MreC [Paenibacillus sp. PsM32]|uniref:Cell shape-determining protein MreC n=1 Tax=Paenibacillus kyungheensis TaxID=1452732 RepID=A0AAX3LYW6_9BACL|nr:MULTISPECIES: rod shape-determining protein MreC [Paenibacillus]MDN4619724.1 rod shape-determining protein MreC [Paenibacillus sp. PsM32]WCT54908.1 rod shape-determining protein MreC [Paenibacillus kyungheensis]